MKTHYLIEYISYNNKGKAVCTYSTLKYESEKWENYKGRSMSDLIKFKYENILKITKTKSLKKVIEFQISN